MDVSNQLKAGKWFYLFPFIGRVKPAPSTRSSHLLRQAWVGGAACCLLKWNFQSRLAPYFSRFAFLKCHFFPFRAFASRGSCRRPKGTRRRSEQPEAPSSASPSEAGVAVRNSWVPEQGAGSWEQEQDGCGGGQDGWLPSHERNGNPPLKTPSWPFVCFLPHFLAANCFHTEKNIERIGKHWKPLFLN